MQPDPEASQSGLKGHLHGILEETNTPAGRWVNGAIALLILLSAVIFVVGTYPLPESVNLLLRRCDRFILGMFTLEYLVRLWVCTPPWRYALSLYGAIDLIAVLPFLLASLDLRYLRLLRWFRLLRLARFFSAQPAAGHTVATDTLIFARILFTLFAIVFIYAGIIFQVEHPYNAAFRTFLDAFYFAFVTMTTVGYGDVTPISEGGRLLTLMMIFTGIALIPTQIGNLIRQFTKVAETVQTPRKNFLCKQCSLSIHDADACYCKRCGAALESSSQQNNP